jgi:hypothetical protein
MTTKKHNLDYLLFHQVNDRWVKLEDSFQYGQDLGISLPMGFNHKANIMVNQNMCRSWGLVGEGSS